MNPRTTWKHYPRRFALPNLLLVALLSSLLVAAAATPAAALTTPTDNFNRANGALGPNWTAMTDGALAISSQAVVGTTALYSGSIRTGETYNANQSSQIQITAPQLSIGQVIGAGVRAQNGGRNLYLGAYTRTLLGSSLRLYKRVNSNWTQLGSYSSGVLAAGTTLQLSASSFNITLSQNGVARIKVKDSSLTGGAPAIMAFDTPQADNWQGGGNATNTPTFSVGGTVSGLAGTLVLQNNGADALTRTANGAFTFATPLQYGATYAVTVRTNPTGQTCTVTNGTGTINTANVTNISVACTNLTFTVGGSVSGLAGSVVLQDNGGDDLTVTANGAFTFATRVQFGAAYAVTVKTNPAGQTCSVTNGAGTMGAANVTNITVACTTTSTSGTVTDDFNRANGGLGTNWTATADGAMAISGQAIVGTKTTNYSGNIRTAETYANDQSSQLQLTATQLTGPQWIGVGVRAQTGGQNMYLGLYWANSGTPVMMLFERTNGVWSQLGATYNSGPLPAGTQLNLTAAGSTLTFSQDGNPRITVTDTTLTGGAPAVMAYDTPTADNWQGTGATGTALKYTVGGSVSGLAGTVVLQDNGADDLTVAANGAFTFATALANGATYNVTVKTNPTGQTCSVTNGTGTMGAANVTNITVTCTTTSTSGTVTDDFNRANGGLGTNWTATADGAMAISGQAIVGTKTTNYSGNIRTAETYANDQSSQLQLIATQLTGGQWIGVGVRAQSGGQNMYLGLYWWQSGTPVMMLFERTNGVWSQLGATYNSGPLPAGTQLNLTAAGSTLTFSQDGNPRITVTDTTLTGGAPAVMAYDTPTADNWQGTGATGTAPPTFTVGGSVSGLAGSVVLQDNGGDDLTVPASGAFTFATALANGATYNVTVKTNPTGQTCSVTNGTGTISTANVTNITVTCISNAAAFSVQFLNQDANGVEHYSVTSANNGPGQTTLRVLRPTHPAAGVAHNFLYALPVEAGESTVYGDPISTLAALDAQDQYNLTIVVPSFAVPPWYADSATDTTRHYETFMASELRPWVNANLSTTGNEQHWLIGFSKSGIGGQDLILKHPDLFTLVASWDFPADMSTYSQYSDSALTYGTNANFQANYRLTQAFVDAHKGPFTANNRIWIGGYNFFQGDVVDYNALLTSEGIAHTLGPMQSVAHRWDGGWVAGAIAGLAQDSINLH